jgi:hypothetical protein
MVEYTCPICNKNFKQKCHFINHTEKKKKPCNPILTKINLVPQKSPKNPPKIPQKSPLISNDKNICMYCFKKYTRTDHLKRHLLKNCKIKKTLDIEKEQIFIDLLERDKLLKKKEEDIQKLCEQTKFLIEQNKELKSKINKIIKNKSVKNINNTNNINNINNINNNNFINIIQYGKEDLSIIDNKYFLDPMLKEMGRNIPLKIIENIHFNPNYPQYQNIYISDINREKCMIHNGKNWYLTNLEKLSDMINKVVQLSYEKHEKFSDYYKNRYDVINKLEIALKYIKQCDDNFLEELQEDEQKNKDHINKCTDFYNHVYNGLKLLLYNKKDIIKNK